MLTEFLSFELARFVAEAPFAVFLLFAVGLFAARAVAPAPLPPRFFAPRDAWIAGRR